MTASDSPVILGIDPGLAQAGYVVLHRSKIWQVPAGIGSLTLGPAMAVYRFGPRYGTDVERGAQYVERLDFWCREARVEVLAIETQFTALRATGAEARGKAHSQQQVSVIRGMLMQAAVTRGLQVVEIAPAQAKKALTGNPQATKEQMIRMVEQRFGIKLKRSEEHIADAIGIALAAERRVPR